MFYCKISENNCSENIYFENYNSFVSERILRARQADFDANGGGLLGYGSKWAFSRKGNLGFQDKREIRRGRTARESIMWSTDARFLI